MGSRGKSANGMQRPPKADRRPHSSVRGLSERSPAVFDLAIGDGFHWADPLDPERKAAWEEWRDRLMVRWRRSGWRPAAWVAFDLPPLMDRVRPWRRDMLERWNAPSDA